jgi:hypothetical protein
MAPGFEVVRVVDKGDGDEWDKWGDDDDDDWMSSPLMEKYASVLDDDNLSKEEKDLERLMKVPKDDMELLKLTRDWVNVIVSDMGICPFSQVDSIVMLFHVTFFNFTFSPPLPPPPFLSPFPSLTLTPSFPFPSRLIGDVDDYNL